MKDNAQTVATIETKFFYLFKKKYFLFPFNPPTFTVARCRYNDIALPCCQMSAIDFSEFSGIDIGICKTMSSGHSIIHFAIAGCDRDPYDYIARFLELEELYRDTRLDLVRQLINIVPQDVLDSKVALWPTTVDELIPIGSDYKSLIVFFFCVMLVRILMCMCVYV